MPYVFTSIASITAGLCPVLFSGSYIVGVLVLLNLACYPFFSVHDFGSHTSFTGSKGFYRIITSMFAHADLWHLTGNVSFLLTVGNELSYALGCDTFAWLFIYAVSGIAGGYLSNYWYRSKGEMTYSVGASGALSGLATGRFPVYNRFSFTVFADFVSSLSISTYTRDHAPHKLYLLSLIESLSLDFFSLSAALVTLRPSASVSLFGLYETGGSPLMFVGIMFANDFLRRLRTGQNIGIFCHLGGYIAGFVLANIYLASF